MKLSRQDKEYLDHALYQAWASVGSTCLEHCLEDQDSEYPPSTPIEEQFEQIVDQLFQSLTPDLCLYVINMKEEEFAAIIQSYTGSSPKVTGPKTTDQMPDKDWSKHPPNAPPAFPLAARSFKKAV